jgi:hypothetical protein
LQFDATREERFLELGRRRTIQFMAAHVSHTGVHDHGFNNFSTYGNLWRLMREGAIAPNEREKETYELALKVSGAVQAARWTPTADGKGYIYSFNGPHSLFVDTARSLRSLAVAHQLGHVLMGEGDRRISLLQRLVEHGETTAAYSIYYGAGRDAYDVPGRTAHEVLFNPNDGSYRCPSTQQGYSPFSTWTRGLAWGMLAFAEQLEFLENLLGGPTVRRDHEPGSEGETPSEAGGTPAPLRFLEGAKRDLARVERPAAEPRAGSAGTTAAGKGGERETVARFLRAATVTADFYLANCCADGIPMWDTGAPNLHRLGDYLRHPADPFNPWEPVDSSAAVIAAQGLVRLGNWLAAKGDTRKGARYRQAGLTLADALFDEPYLSFDARHQGLLLHSVYHRPNRWDYVAPGQKVPNGESSMWGDYHARELALLLLREAKGELPLRFFAPGSATLK